MRASPFGCALLLVTGCAAFPSPSPDGGAATVPGVISADGGCALLENATSTAQVSDRGCALLERDTSACRAARAAQGLSGHWLKFSCRVPLEKVTASGGEQVRIQTDSVPDYRSNYWASGHQCWEAYTLATQNPNRISALSLTLDLPLNPGTGGANMMGAVVGVAANGVVMFSNRAAPGDDIFREAQTFDRCGGHPQMAGVYHYHSEPLALSQDDARFVGVLRDGHPIYGRRELDGGVATGLDNTGGHTGTTEDSPTTPVFHYHVNEQTSATAGTAGQKQWFLTKGVYKGTPGSCSGSGC
jgi:hypothetical protein